jgi:hypothetical protein
MPEYKTHVGLVLTLSEVDGNYRVLLTGDRVKVVYEGKDKDKADTVYAETVAHYAQRKKDESGS